MRLFELYNLIEAKSDTVVFSFGRMNPPTLGHQKLVQKVLSVARQNDADHIIFLSQTHKPGKDPLPWKDKIAFFRKMFPGVNVSTNEEVKNPYGALMVLGETYDNVILVVGSDRVATFKNGMTPYLEEYGINNFDVVSAGERDPDADDVSGMSASKARALAVEGSWTAFAKALPSTLKNADKRAIYRLIRQNS